MISFLNKNKDSFLLYSFNVLYIAFILNSSLWGKDRVFDAVSFFNISINNSLHYVSFFLLFFLLLSFFKRSKIIFFSIFLLGCLSGVLDVNVIQPFFIFLNTFYFLKFFSKDDFEFTSGLRIALFSTYFFAGFQKINPMFFSEVVPWLTQLDSVLINSSVAFLIIIFEISIGMLFLFAKFKKFLLPLLLFSNTLILCAIFWDPNIHWLIALWVILLSISALYLYSFDLKGINLRLFLKSKKYLLFNLFFVVVPFLGYFGVIPAYLSSKIYSGNTNTAFVYSNETGYVSFDKIWRDHNSVFPFPELWNYKEIFNQICDSSDYGFGKMIINKNDSWFNEVNIIEISCHKKG